jgi:hypothetical protein
LSAPGAENYFEIVGEISSPETIAIGLAIRQLEVLRQSYGEGRWCKMKGIAMVRTAGGTIRKAELHWYEAHGVGRKRMKIKKFLD